MIPIKDDDNGARGKPWITWLLITANIAAFVFIQGFGANTNATTGLAVVPAEILSGRDIATPAERYIEPWTGRIVASQGLARTPIPVLLTLLTSLFLHGGLTHLLGNMLFLGVFGDNVEGRLGRLRYLALYLGSGIAGALAQVLASVVSGSGLYTPMIGASGAISGVMGAYLALFPANRVAMLAFGFLPVTLSARLAIGSWFVLQLWGGLAGWSSGVAYLAHIFGFLSGALVGRRLRRADEYAARRAYFAQRQAYARRAARYGEDGGIAWRILD